MLVCPLILYKTLAGWKPDYFNKNVINKKNWNLYRCQNIFCGWGRLYTDKWLKHKTIFKFVSNNDDTRGAIHANQHILWNRERWWFWLVQNMCGTTVRMLPEVRPDDMLRSAHLYRMYRQPFVPLRRLQRNSCRLLLLRWNTARQIRGLETKVIMIFFISYKNNNFWSRYIRWMLD